MILNYVKHEVRTNTLEVSWIDFEIGEDGEPLKEKQVKCHTYSQAQKADFLAEVEGAAAYIAAIGW